MENKFNRFLSLLLAVVMVVGMIPGNFVFAAENDTPDSETTSVVNETPTAEISDTDVAMIGDQGYESVAAALDAAYAAGMKDVVITLIGETNAQTTDSFDLYSRYAYAFNNITVRQEDATKPYYLKTLYTAWLNAGGKFVLDGVNIVLTDYMGFFGCGGVELINNSVVNSAMNKGEGYDFVVQGSMTIEPGSQFFGLNETIYAGASLTVNGGKTDGTYNSAAGLQAANVTLSGELSLKDGAYVVVSNGEFGQLTVNGTLNIQDARLDVFTVISLNGVMNVDAGSVIKTKQINGTGKIVLDATDMTEGTIAAFANVNMSGFTGNIEVANGDGLEAKIVDGKITLVKSAVAKIGETGYATLADAIAAAQPGDTVTLISDIELTETVTVNGTVTLELNGKKLSGVNSEAKASAVIKNNGSLTIQDTVGGGIITSKTLNPDPTNNPTYANNTINNYGTLTVKSGIIENASTGYACYAIDSYSGAVTVIEGGIVRCVDGSYGDSIRLFAGASATTSLVVTGGDVGTIWAQNTSSDKAADVLYAVTIEDGATVGTLYLEPTANANVAITGGEIGNVVLYVVDAENTERNASGFISGGIFGSAVSEDLLAEGITLAKKPNGTFAAGKLPEAQIDDLGSVTIVDGNPEEEELVFEDSYYIYDLIGNTGLSTGTAPFDLQLAMKFTAKDDAASSQLNAYGDYFTDFHIQISGLKDGYIYGDGCYLAGYYKSFGAWVVIPLDGFKIEDGKAYPMITAAGFNFTYEDICGGVEEFICGIYMAPEILAANPDLEVSVSLGLSETVEDALASEFVTVGEPLEYGVEEMHGVVDVDGVGYDSLAAALAAATDGSVVTLLQDVKVTGKQTITAAITIDGNGYSIIADENAVWYTVSGKLNLKSYNIHLIGVNSDNVTLKNVVLDCNNNAAGINVYCAQNVVFDNVSIINATKGMAALTVNGSTLTAKNAFTALGNAIAIDVSNGTGVTSALGLTMEEGTVVDLGNKTVKFASVATMDVTGAKNADGTPYFAAKDVAYFYTQAQIDSRTTAFSNGLTLLADVHFDKDITIKGTLDLNGQNLTVADGKAIKISGNATVNGDVGETKFVLTTKTATLTAPEGLTVESGVETHYVSYKDGAYSLILIVAQNVQTGKYYNSVNEALDEAVAGETVKMLANDKASMTYIPEGVTLDLNGFAYTVTYMVVFNGGNVVDNSESNAGLLVVDPNKLMINNKNAQLPVKTESGYVFVEIEGFAEMWGKNDYYIAQFYVEAAARELLKSDMAAAGVSIYVRVSWTNSSGRKRSQDFEYSNEKIAQYLNSYNADTGKYGSQIFLNLTGTDENTQFTYQVVIASDLGVEFISNGYTK